MPLPKISTPTYHLVLPSIEKEITYRPFLVKEEKLLVLALESEDTKQITTAIKAVIKACILTKGIKVDTLPTFDIEYLFLNIRGKSVGESIDVNVICPDDKKTQVQVTIDLDDIKVTKSENHTNQIKVDDNIMIDDAKISAGTVLDDSGGPIIIDKNAIIDIGVLIHDLTARQLLDLP